MPAKSDIKGFNALLVTQYLGAFNDNAFKLVISLLAVSLFVTKEGGTQYVSMAGAAFVLPFLLFSSYAGFFADRLSKRTIIVAAKIAELIIMIFGLIAFYVGNIWFMISVLFLMGAQSAFFGPSKYGIIPELLSEEKLSWGNGILNMWTYIAIITGMTAGVFLYDIYRSNIYMVSIYFILISIFGIIASLFVTKVSPSGSNRVFKINFFAEIYETMKEVKKYRGLFLSILGTIYFTFLAGLFQLTILIYAKNMMGLSEAYTGTLITIIALGIGVGSLIAGKLSGDRIEFGLVPIGAMGMSIFCVLLGYSYSSLIWTAVYLFLLGASTGMFLIPLLAYIQGRSHPQKLGRVLAADYFLEFLGILIASGLLWFLRDVIKINSAQIFFYCGIVTIIITSYICTLLPGAMIRFIIWFATHSICRMRIIGKENIPIDGPVLLISNNISIIDGFLIQFSLNRPAKFVVYRKELKNPLIKILFGLADAIPVSEDDSPEQTRKSLNEAKKNLGDNGIVCIFTEEQLSRNGCFRKFNNDLKKMIKNSKYQIVPVSINIYLGNKVLMKKMTISYEEALPNY